MLSIERLSALATNIGIPVFGLGWQKWSVDTAFNPSFLSLD